MVRTCSAFGCKSVNKTKQDKEKKLSFFTFPLKNPRLLHQWVRAVSRENFHPKKHSQLCSLHFRPCDLLDRPGTYRPQLKPDAVPSIFPSYPSHLQPKPVKSRRILQYKNDVKAGLPLPPRPDHAYCSRATENSSHKLLHASGVESISDTNDVTSDCSSQQQQQQQHLSGVRAENLTTLHLRKKIKVLQQQLRRQRAQIEGLKRVIQQMKKD